MLFPRRREPKCLCISQRESFYAFERKKLSGRCFVLMEHQNNRNLEELPTHPPRTRVYLNVGSPWTQEEGRCRLLSNTVVNYDIHVKHRTDHLDGKVLRNNRRPHGLSGPPELWGLMRKIASLRTIRYVLPSSRPNFVYLRSWARGQIQS